MSDTWVDLPRKAPHRCRRSGRDGAAEGPYFEDSLPYCEAPGDDRELTNYVSLGWLRAICDAPGSPVELAPRGIIAELKERINEAERECARMQEQLAQAPPPPAPVVSPIDVEALAAALVVPLGDHFSRKPGPKKVA